MSRRQYTGPQGKLQRAFYERAKSAPRTLHPMPESQVERTAIKRLAEKGFVDLFNGLPASFRLKPR